LLDEALACTTVFTEEERDRICRWLLDWAEADERVVAAAIVGWRDCGLGSTGTISDGR